MIDKNFDFFSKLAKIFEESSLQLRCQELQHNSNQVFLSALSFLDTIILYGCKEKINFNFRHPHV